jgi:hypothetical protein
MPNPSHTLPNQNRWQPCCSLFVPPKSAAEIEPLLGAFRLWCRLNPVERIYSPTRSFGIVWKVLMDIAWAWYHDSLCSPSHLKLLDETYSFVADTLWSWRNHPATYAQLITIALLQLQPNGTEATMQILREIFRRIVARSEATRSTGVMIVIQAHHATGYRGLYER